MTNKLSVKIAGILIVVMILIMALFTAYFVRSRSANMEQELLSKGRIEALTGAQVLEHAYLKDEQVVFAVLVDHNGYLPTHNSKYSLPLTGNRDKDKVGNRTK